MQAVWSLCGGPVAACVTSRSKQFWSPDEELIQSLGDDLPPYVHQLGKQEADGHTGAGS